MNGEDQFATLERVVGTMKNVHITGRSDDSIAIQFKNDEGVGAVRRYALFPGIFLSFNDMETGSFPRFKGEIIQGCKINFCVDGRCEVKLSNGIYQFIEAGDISFTNLTVSDNYQMPYERYHGIELHIYDSALKQEALPLFQNFDIDLNRICERFYSLSGNFVAKASKKIESVFLEMTDIVSGAELDYLRLKVTELLFLLMHTEMPAEKERGNFLLWDR